MNAARRLWASGWARAGAALAAAGCALAFATSHGADAGGVLNVRLAGDSASTRVVVELDQGAKARLVPSAVAARTVVLAWPELDGGKELSGPGKGLVSGWSVEEAAGAVRLRLSLKGDAEVARRFLLPPGDGVAAYRYVIDLKPRGPSGAPPAPARVVVQSGSTASAKAPSKRASTPVLVSAPKPSNGKRVIVIDAGHGGRDPGAAGVHGRESAVTLAAAKALKTRLERGGRYKVVLTRDKDAYLPLETRVRIARQAKADLFISLHADAGSEPGLRGASVYTLSEGGSDRVARKVMAKDRSLGDFALPAQNAAVNSILLDLTQRATRNQSATFAQLLLAEVDDVAPLLRHSHRDAGYVVLLAPDVPAVLLEMGFMTNPQDEALLRDPKRRTAMMNKVGDSIDAYFAQSARYAQR